MTTAHLEKVWRPRTSIKTRFALSQGLFLFLSFSLTLFFLDQTGTALPWASLLQLLAVFWILGVALAFFQAALAARHIRQLTEAAIAIRIGHLNKEIPEVTTQDELEQLNREFTKMVGKLHDSYSREHAQKAHAMSVKHHLEEVNTHLTELDRQRSDFLNAASHQLRTPLSIIHWSLSLIVEEGAYKKLPKKEQNLLEDSLKSSRRMVDLVNDLLDVARIEQGRKELSLKSGNYADICQQLVDALQILAKNKDLKLSFEKIGEIPDSYLDEQAVYQIVNNFVDNAIKYTAQGHVKVSCQAQGEHVEIVVEDTGIGITEEVRKHMFSQFNRGREATSLVPNGAGLGMYVAYTLLHMHGGDVRLRTQPGKGTTFTLLLPLYRSSKIARKPLG